MYLLKGVRIAFVTLLDTQPSSKPDAKIMYEIRYELGQLCPGRTDTWTQEWSVALL